MASLKKNLVYNFLLSGSQVLLPLITIPYISRVLDPDGVGRVSFIDSFTYYFITMAEFGIMVYGMREVAREKNNPTALKKLLNELLVLHIISSGVSLVIYSVSVYFIWQRIGDVRLLLFSFSFLLVNFLACEWYFLGLERFRYITIRSLVTRILGMVSIFLLVKAREDYYIYYGIIAGAAILNSVWNNLVLFREIPLNFRNVHWKRHIRFTWVTYLISLVYSIPLMLDNVLLGLVSTTIAVGFYAFAMKMVKTTGMLLTDGLLVFFPRIVQYVK
ncbi:MAG TPA: oligosaccharide flippase family protein, partial [Flavitalea sp.]|nr:oligosaccharide flippase family protein [Flavitalea sp.]